MQISVSGKFSYDVFDEAFAVQDIVRRFLDGSNVGAIKAPIERFVYFPVIISDKFDIPKKSHRSYSRKENTEFVNVEIRYSDWMISDHRSRVSLMIGGLRSAIEETSEKKIDGHSKRELLGLIECLGIE